MKKQLLLGFVLMSTFGLVKEVKARYAGQVFNYCNVQCKKVYGNYAYSKQNDGTYCKCYHAGQRRQ